MELIALQNSDELNPDLREIIEGAGNEERAKREQQLAPTRCGRRIAREWHAGRLSD